jgi:peptide subunit release factor 1 (eRF1)
MKNLQLVTISIPDTKSIKWVLKILNDELKTNFDKPMLKKTIENIISLLPTIIPGNGIIIHAGFDEKNQMRYDIMKPRTKIYERFAIIDGKFHLLHYLL